LAILRATLGKFLPVLAALLFVPATRSEAQTALDSVRKLDSAWARAYATHDTTLALALFADEPVVTSGTGALKNTQGELADVRPQPGLVMRFFRRESTSGGRTSTARRRYTSVFARGGALGWRMVALHMGRAPEPAPGS
jgi:ketosteroid isomerase-like protein